MQVPVPPTFDCSMRWLAYEYGTKLIVRPTLVPRQIVNKLRSRPLIIFLK